MFPLFDNSLQLSTAINKALENLPFVRHLPRSAPNPQWTLPDQYGGLVNEQVAHWKRVVIASGLKVSQ
jgi:hypothetical protein